MTKWRVCMTGRDPVITRTRRAAVEVTREQVVYPDRGVIERQDQAGMWEMVSVFKPGPPRSWWRVDPDPSPRRTWRSPVMAGSAAQRIAADLGHPADLVELLEGVEVGRTPVPPAW
jgi:hypothetical protein